jgi:hypothetical protein
MAGRVELKIGDLAFYEDIPELTADQLLDLGG